MDAATQRIADDLKQAIQAENDGHHFYLMAAASTEDPQGKEIFETLAREEQEHQAFLKNQYRAILETGRPDPRLQLGQQASLVGASPIFSPAIRSRLGQAHFEMTALSVAIQLEASAIQFYRQSAERASEPAARDFFRQLTEWETGHHEALLRQQQALREDYWSAGGFSAF